MKKFWNWKSRKIRDQAGEEVSERVLFLNGMIAEESWFDDDVTPELFREELNAGSGNITVWINSPGGDCVAAAQIYNMLMDYKGEVTVKVDGLAASAASVIAMAGTKVLMSPVSMMMVHNPATVAFGDKGEMQRAIHMLAEVKESIVNAYEIKTGLGRARLSSMMDAETWMNAHKAVELGFADGILAREDAGVEGAGEPDVSALYSRAAVANSLMGKLAAKCRIKAPDAVGDGSAGENSRIGGDGCAGAYGGIGGDGCAGGNSRAGGYGGTGGEGRAGAAETGNNVGNGRSCDEIRERLDFIRRFI